MDLEIGDIVLCTVDRISGTIVFVKIHGNKIDIPGSIVFSEVAPGRIRNIRNYVVPKKKIVCKVLRIAPNRIDLSLRRVTLKEKKEILEENKQEKSYENILRSILKEKASEIIKEIKKIDNLYDFVGESKKDSKKLEKIIGKKDSKKFLDIINFQKNKKAVLKKKFNLKTTKKDGLNLIKKILLGIKDCEIKYISAGEYSLKVEEQDLKKASNKIKEILSLIEEKSKKFEIEFNTKKE